MTVYVALLRAVNVGGTGKLPMATFRSLCEEAGFTKVRTVVASGNVVLESRLAEHSVKALLEARLQAHLGAPVRALVRTRQAMRSVHDDNPFAGRPANRTIVLFLDEAPAADANKRATHRTTEEIAGGKRELYCFYPDGMGQSKLALPEMKVGTARNMNTVAKLVEIAGSY